MEYDEVVTFIERFGLDLVHEPSVGALGVSASRIGQREIVGSIDDYFCVTVYVERLLSAHERRARGLQSVREACQDIATRHGVKIDPHDVEVVAVGERFRSQAYHGSSHGNPPAVNTQKWFQALMPGTGICNPTNSYPNSLEVGTIAFFTKDAEDDLFLVSCNHVIALERTQAGQPPPEAILQPGTSDFSGSDLTKFATLTDLTREFCVAELWGFVPVRLHQGSNTPSNTADVAIARLRKEDRS